ncbi:alpha/beta hydrolase [Amycolatopsis ultiminotia]|uniref:Alpha/beta hydrolase n=1 Tax=Amycolatopsis ultiminotia TaxID=543629 RepID=A0ABP6WA51_9PSEU
MTKASAAVALLAIVGGGVLAGCDDAVGDDDDLGAPAPSVQQSNQNGQDAPADAKKITVGGHSVNVSCTGTDVPDRPVVVLMAGMGDDLTKLAGLQKTLSRDNRVCSYDRLGEGKSDKPAGPQNVGSSGEILTGVLDQVAGRRPVVLAGHSAGGLLAARYAPEHQDRIKGVVLMDATPSTMIADTSEQIPESATGDAGELRKQSIAVFGGENPELLRFEDGPVQSAGDIPVAVIRHGGSYLSDIPQYGKGLEQAWVAGQRKWLALSSHSEAITAPNSGHYIYTDAPDLAAQTIERITSQVAK